MRKLMMKYDFIEKELKKVKKNNKTYTTYTEISSEENNDYAFACIQDWHILHCNSYSRKFKLVYVFLQKPLSVLQEKRAASNSPSNCVTHF